MELINDFNEHIKLLLHFTASSVVYPRAAHEAHDKKTWVERVYARRWKIN